MNYPAIELRDVSLKLGDEYVLKNVSLKVNHGEFLVIIGPSGYGKTVLLKTMAGIHTPTSGHVFVEGEDWQNLESEDKHKLAEKVGMLFQKSALFDSLTVIENVIFPIREHTDYSEDKMKDIAVHFLIAVGLKDALDKLPHELSGGMQRRLGIARALALNPDILFYDDPTSGQDPINSEKISKLILELKKKNKSTVIAVTNSMPTAKLLADRIVMVANGEVFEVGTPSTIVNSQDPRVQQFIHGQLKGPLNIET